MHGATAQAPEDLRGQTASFLLLAPSGRPVGPPATLYTVDCFGISDSALHNTRDTIAAGASTETAGKNPDLVLYAIDGAHGTLDPAFDAHAIPIKMWAQAVAILAQAMLAQVRNTLFKFVCVTFFGGCALGACFHSPFSHLSFLRGGAPEQLEPNSATV